MAVNRTSGRWAGSAPPAAAAGDCYVVRIQPGNLTRIDPRARDIAPDGSCSVLPPPPSSPQRHIWQTRRVVVVPREKAVIYELHVPSFTSQGTFDAAAARLDHLSALGVTVLELMPVAYYCGDAAGWGYGPCAPFAVKPELGGSRGLKRFVDAAAARGIAVWLDVVFNHHAGGSLLRHYDSPAPGPDIYYYTSPSNRTKWGPRPDFDSVQVREYFLENLRMWMDEFRIGGFRWDSTVCIRNNGATCWLRNATRNPAGWRLLQAGTDTIHGDDKHDPASAFSPSRSSSPGVSGAMAVAEDNAGFEDITRPTTDSAAGPPGSRGGAGFDGQWAYPWFHATVDEITQGTNRRINASAVAAACATGGRGAGSGGGFAGGSVLFSENHDQASNQNAGRIPFRVDGAHPGANRYWAQKKSVLLMSLVLACPGLPMLLQGQEMLAYQNFTFPAPPALDWTLLEHNAGTFRAVRDLVALRTDSGNSSAALLGGDARVLAVDDDGNSTKVATLLRRGSAASGNRAARLVLVLNLQNTCHPEYALSGVPLDGTWRVRFDGDSALYSALYGDCCAANRTVAISSGRGTACVPPMAVLMLSPDQGEGKEQRPTGDR